MDIVEMDMVDRKFLIVIYLGRLPRIISRTCLDSLVLLWLVFLLSVINFTVLLINYTLFGKRFWGLKNPVVWKKWQICCTWTIANVAQHQPFKIFEATASSKGDRIKIFLGSNEITLCKWSWLTLIICFLKLLKGGKHNYWCHMPSIIMFTTLLNP